MNGKLRKIPYIIFFPRVLITESRNYSKCALELIQREEPTITVIANLILC